MTTESYVSPFSGRYSSPEMSHLFSPQFKYSTWRRLWVALARAQKTLGINITKAQIDELETHIDTLNLDRAHFYEKQMRHDVMAHIHAYGEQCPSAKGIIHMGATSCYVTDNTDLIQMQAALTLLRAKLYRLIEILGAFAHKHASLPTLSYTHLQPSQPTTVGKRACLWLQDFVTDFHAIEHTLSTLRFLGAKGATGTQASFLSLFHNDHEKVKKLDHLIAEELGFTRLFPISGQTYPRKQDIQTLSTLSSFGASAHKCATDIRLLAHMKEVDEPFGSKQVGSSAMPHKRNPMRSERICGLARYLISLNENPLYTAATQWLERTLDDSANRRLALPESFLAADALLNLLIDTLSGLIIYPKAIEKHLREELPFLCAEAILMKAVSSGKDRQTVHEHLREHCLQREEDLFERIASDPRIGLSHSQLNALLDPSLHIGRSAPQVHEFLTLEVAPILSRGLSAPIHPIDL